MLMKKLAAMLVLAGVAFGGAVVGAQDKPKSAEKKAGEAGDKAKDAAADGMDPGMEEAWQKAGQINENHKLITDMAGSWKCISKFWMVPGSEPMVSEMTAEVTAIMGGRFTQGKYKGNVMGQPFEGLEYMGYDNIKKKFVSSWIDNMGTALYTSAGELEPGTGVITLLGTADDPMTGKTKKTRATIKIDGPDKHTFTFFETPDGGQEMRTMEIVYTRVK